jgi:hypothetical protein
MNQDEICRCACGTLDHQVVVSLYADGECPPDLYLGIHLDNCGGRFWRRLWYALRYIFGYKSRYGAWDELIFTPEGALKLRDVIDRYLEETEAFSRKETGYD